METINIDDFGKTKADYSECKETLYLVSAPGMREKLMNGMKEPLENCLSEEEVDWNA